MLLRVCRRRRAWSVSQEDQVWAALGGLGGSQQEIPRIWDVAGDA
jgi:hypothetical protein